MGETATKPGVQLRDVEADDLSLFFEHQRDPIAVALVGFCSRDQAAFDQHWAKLLADFSCLKKTIVADGQVAGISENAGLPLHRRAILSRGDDSGNGGRPRASRRPTDHVIGERQPRCRVQEPNV